MVTAIGLARYTMRTIGQNPFRAFFSNSIGIPVAAGTLYKLGFLLNPMIGGAAMAFSSVGVVGNSLLMRRYKRPLLHPAALLLSGRLHNQVEMKSARGAPH